MTLRRIFQASAWALSALLLSGCASMTPEKARALAAEMAPFERCLALGAKMDRRTFRLSQEVLQAVRESAEVARLDCQPFQQEIIDFLVQALRQEEQRNERFRFFFGFGLGSH